MSEIGVKPKEEKEEWREDVEELQEVLKAVSQFISDLKEPIKDIITMLMNALDGKKLGEDVAQFYRRLIDSGVPEDMARDLTKEFFQKKLESAPKLSSLVEMLSKAMRAPRAFKELERPELRPRASEEERREEDADQTKKEEASS